MGTLCAETLAGIADPLFPALSATACVAPGEAARAMLAALVAPLEHAGPPVAIPAWLLPHQADAVRRAHAIAHRFGGVLVADGAGLGKTYIGLALAAIERQQGGGTLVVAPAALRGEWERAAAQVHEPLRLLSHTSLAGPPRPPEPAVSLLVVDEAHAFRNRHTMRYDGLARLAVGRRVVLLTATPVNNGPGDLAALIHLFAGAGCFRAFGVPDLFASLDEPESPGVELALASLTVSRSRRLVEARFPELRRAFPHRHLLRPVRYDLQAVYGGRLDDVLDPLATLQDLAGDEERAAALLLLGLLRRLESSRAAFIRTLRRHDAYLREWRQACIAGRRLTRHDVRRGDDDPEGAQLAFWPLLLDRAAAAADTAHRWAGAVGRALAVAERTAAADDVKCEALATLLEGPLRARKSLVFTEYRDTAIALARALRRRFRVLCLTGDSAWVGSERLSRREALDAFAPRARGAAPNRLLDADVLVATDVASEGMNLQDACAVVNYDLPWNPVRVMQRVARIDRLYSPHAEIAVAHVVSDGGLGDLAGVLRTLRRKLARVVGSTPEPDPLGALWWVETSGPLPEALERESWRRVEPFEARERWRAAAGTSPPRGRPCVGAGIVDDGIGAAAGVLLAIEWPDGRRIPVPYVLEPGGTVRCDAHALGALAERARGALPMVAAPADFRAALAAILPDARRRLLACSAARYGAPAEGPGRRAALRRVAGLARRAAERRDGSALDALAEVSERLRDELPAGVDRTVADACLATTPDDVCVSRLLEALQHVATPQERLPQDAPRLVLVAALALAAGPCDSGGDAGVAA